MNGSVACSVPFVAEISRLVRRVNPTGTEHGIRATRDDFDLLSAEIIVRSKDAPTERQIERLERRGPCFENKWYSCKIQRKLQEERSP